MFRRSLLLLCATALTAGLAPLVTAQQQNVTSARQTAEKSWLGGRYEEIDTIAQAFPKDENIAIFHALSVAARGDYARAENILKPFATANPDGDAALELGLIQLGVGRRTEGRQTLTLVLMADVRNPSARDYVRAARASRALHRIDDANSYFKDAIRLAPNDVVLNTEWGDFFVENHENGEAAKSYQEALKVSPEYGPALLGMGKALANENPPQAAMFAQRALKQNPNHAGAHLLLAEMAIYQDKKAEAKEAIDQVLEVNPRHLEALSMKAALAYVEGDLKRYNQIVAEALKINPIYGELHRIVGSITAYYYRFDEAVEHTRKAIALDRENFRAIASLGEQLMRTGDERNARRNLETAFRIDRWDVMTYNLLEVLDKLDTFETINDGDMVIRLPPDEAPVMKEYAPQLAREALDALSKRWEFTPKGPLLIEMFSEHDDFAVRTLGLPGMLGALGACFGRVVTVDSPRARDPGTFNWGETLWHEMAHVITLQLSNNRLPRWLSEGTSVFEERRARKEWGRDMDLPFVRYLESGKVLKIRDLNTGFSSSQTISYTYYQASLLVEHIFDVHGQRKLRALVEAYADGTDTEGAIKKALGISIDELQASFDAALDTRYASLRRALKVPEGLAPGTPPEKIKAIAAANPDSFPAQMALGDSLAETNPDAAITAFEKAAELIPTAGGEDSPYAAIAALALKKGDKVRAARALEQLTANTHTDVASARQLASLLDPNKDPARVRTALQRAVAVDPFDAESSAVLGRLALKAGDTAEAIRAFRATVASKPLDKASAHADLAEALLQAGQKEEARKQVMEALLVAPTFTRAQDLLLKIAGGGSR
ncbi:MAG TPA: tetratricopeptide repeat protein [Vicinamibacterales bacterium]|nr:tetratricopeptide repeat protein [Vicinamibacterales bacterium]